MIVREWITDCHDCAADLDDPAGIEAALRNGALRVGATVLGISTTRYQPVGLTVFLPLAESHLLVSTWPEYRFAIVGILLCNDTMDPGLAQQLVLGHLRPARVQLHKVEHRVEAPARAGEAGR